MVSPIGGSSPLPHQPIDSVSDKQKWLDQLDNIIQNLKSLQPGGNVKRQEIVDRIHDLVDELAVAQPQTNNIKLVGTVLDDCAHRIAEGKDPYVMSMLMNAHELLAL